MATIRHRGDLQWQAIVRRKGYPEQCNTFEIKKDAEAWARMIERDIDTGAWRNRKLAESTTLSECLIRYEKEILPKKKSYVQERSIIKQFKEHPLASCYMAFIRSKDIAEFRDQRLKRVKASTVRRDLAVLSHVFTISRMEWGMESLENPVMNTHKPHGNNSRTRRLLPGEEKILLDALSDNPTMQAIFTLALETAMRRSEIVSMRWEHVALKRKEAHLPETKNGTPRDVPLSSRAIKVLRSLPRRIDGRVFDMRPDSVTQAFIRACKRSEIEGLRFHDLRHEATSRLADRLGVHELASVTGHKDLRMLMRYYHPRASDLAKKLA